ncbi:MAG: TetR/AcrR family transcriptional regulator [Eubacteriales bacterium]
MKVEYSEKEIAIFNGMLNLLKDGANPHMITVSEIARSAGIGKGTIYDYFQTKEEVISKAILFNMQHEIENFYKRMKGKDGFKQQYFEVLKIIEENMENMFSSFNLFLSVGSFLEVKDVLFQENSDFTLYRNRLQEVVDELLYIGSQEGIIQEIQEDDYRRMVIKSSFYAFVNFIHLRHMYRCTTIEDAKRHAYKMVIKSLN